jgi:SHS2 domain-containing protein
MNNPKGVGMGTYEFVEDLTSDVMFEAEGKTLADLLDASARAMFSVICEIGKVEPVTMCVVKASGDDEKALLFDFLGRLLTASEIKGLFLSGFDVRVEKNDSGYDAVVTAYGENLSRDKGGTVVKGIAMYGFSVEKTADGYKARVAMDV